VKDQIHRHRDRGDRQKEVCHVEMPAAPVRPEPAERDEPGTPRNQRKAERPDGSIGPGGLIHPPAGNPEQQNLRKGEDDGQGAGQDRQHPAWIGLSGPVLREERGGKQQEPQGQTTAHMDQPIPPGFRQIDGAQPQKIGDAVVQAVHHPDMKHCIDDAQGRRDQAQSASGLALVGGEDLGIDPVGDGVWHW
jgi:hypothetical protein